LIKDTLYAKLMIKIKEKIDSGFWIVDEVISSEAELEREYQVSNITVRRALKELSAEGVVYRIKGKGTYINKDYYEKSKKEHVRPKVITVIMPYDPSKGGAQNAVAGMSDYLQDSGTNYLLNIVNSHNSRECEREIIKKAERISSGIVLYSAPSLGEENLDLICELLASGYPMVSIDKNYGNVPVLSVQSDNRAGAYAATKYLIDNGHRNIAFVCNAPVSESSSVVDRFLGYCNALNDNGIELRSENVFADYVRIAKEHCRPAYKELMQKETLVDSFFLFYKTIFDMFLNRANPITAAFCINDYIAVDLYKTAKNIGVSIPETVSVIGFDNLSFAGYLSPPLTTVEQNMYEIGYKAMELLISKIVSDSGDSENTVINVPTKLIERESVLDIRAGREKSNERFL